MHRASAAERLPAAELGAGHAEHVAQYPQERRVAVDVDALNAAVDFQLVGHGVLSCGCRFASRFQASTCASSIKFPQGSAKNASRRPMAGSSKGSVTMVTPRRRSSASV